MLLFRAILVACHRRARIHARMDARTTSQRGRNRRYAVWKHVAVGVGAAHMSRSFSRLIKSYDDGINSTDRPPERRRRPTTSSEHDESRNTTTPELTIETTGAVGARGLARGGASGGFPIWEVAFAFLGRKGRKEGGV